MKVRCSVPRWFVVEYLKDKKRAEILADEILCTDLPISKIARTLNVSEDFLLRWY